MSTPAAPISAVFVLEISDYSGPLLAGWLERGNSIKAIVVPALRPKRGRFSIGNFRRKLQRGKHLSRYLGKTDFGLPDFELIEFGRPYDWDKLGRQLSEIAADVLICFAFPAIIPQSLLGLFPNGGLNLHPSLLPHYRGPHPLHRMVVDQQQDAFGGVTLHKMTPRFDEGDILAQVPVAAKAWLSRQALVKAHAEAMRIVVSESATAYCRGELTGAPQPTGDFTWARIDMSHTLVSTNMSIEHVTRLWTVLGLAPGIYLTVGDAAVRLAFRIRTLGPATGKPPVRRWGAVSFDLANGRVVHLTYSRTIKRLVKIWQRFERDI
ncbi:formyltransferase family protein [Mesorhizobium sp.]|uniref:formyltransferase family protein n=1 Tax=Mesorhizobium sp. TaxID=1871066 RepID=UPI003BA9DE3C